MDLPIQFDNPGALLLCLLIPPVVWFGWRHLTGMSPLRRGIICALRSLVIALIAVTVAQPKWLERSESMTVILMIDRSHSISHQLEANALEYLRRATDDPKGKQPFDRLGVINIGAEARVVQVVDRATILEPNTTIEERNATNLAHAVRLGLAIAPRDSAVRFVLVSDGNETTGNVMTVADIARANKIPIDVLKLTYDYQKEVKFERIMAPSMAREGQPISLRFALRSRQATTGRISLYQNDTLIDLNADDPASMSVPVQLEEGINVRTVNLTLSQKGPQRFRAEFEPDNPQDDPISTNNRADAVVVVGGEGRVLVIHETTDETASLRAAMRDAAIEVDTALPSEVTSDLLFLSGYDSIVLANVPAHAFGAGVDDALRRYVHDIGGGLIMLGGPDSFGAGGWINSEVSKALPVRLDPPEKSQMPKGALVCIMHSSEIPQGNYWGQQCAIAAVEALSRLDDVGIIDFDWNVGGPNAGCNWVYKLSPAGDKSGAISAIKKMTMGDMPDFAPSMQMALTALQNNTAGQKHVIIISDGDPSPPGQAMINQFIASKISISTVIAGGHGNPQDVQQMANIARQTGGTAYNPSRPNQMPKIFIKEAMIVRRSLIVEGETYQAIHQPTGRPGPFAGRWPALPTMQGYVLTAPRPGYDPEIVSNFGDRDPIMAQWQYGLGKSIAFTSDATSRWGQAWVDWADFQGFWEQVVRWSMRPAAPTNIQQSTRIEGNKAIVEVNVLGSDNQFANFGKISALVLSPGLKEELFNLQQIAPGKWRGEYTVDEEGSWIANMIYESADGERSSIQSGVSVPYSPEFSALRDNAPLMTNLARVTQGRELPSDPAQADLFNREGLETPKSLTDIWPLMAIIAAGLFLMDVAARRLAIDPIALRRRMYALMHGGSSSAGQSLDRLKQTRSEVQERVTGRRKSSQQIAEEREAAEARFEADAAGGAAIDLDKVGSDEGEGSLKKPPPARTKPEPAADEADEGSYTSRLLEAKRRARQQGKDKPQGGGDG
ncbi:MAG: hypothetical protein IT430_13140 [Phycisphaerales bacterium]|nr:hypothetical protein [Phycisphaerales bacterium]